MVSGAQTWLSFSPQTDAQQACAAFLYRKIMSLLFTSVCSYIFIQHCLNVTFHWDHKYVSQKHLCFNKQQLKGTLEGDLLQKTPWREPKRPRWKLENEESTIKQQLLPKLLKSEATAETKSFSRKWLWGLTSEFLGWVVEVSGVWLNHTAVVHKPEDTDIVTMSRSLETRPTLKDFKTPNTLWTFYNPHIHNKLVLPL